MSTRKVRRRNLFNRWFIKRKKLDCYWCGVLVCRLLPESHPKAATVDHLLPKSKGGTFAQKNLVVACFHCNNLRGCSTWLFKERESNDASKA